MRYFLYITIAIAMLSGCRTNETAPKETTQSKPAQYQEKYRLQGHFSPPENWMNDPNGMVYYDGEYHLFYQHYPDSNVWGPMHWGHAISKDLVHWENQPIALYPDSLGMIFSGSAVVDASNVSGFGTADSPPLVAMFTYHSREKENAGRIDYQTQGIAYSTDKGRTWKKYNGNPVIANPGIKDFRDPKMIWHEPTKKWVVVLAVDDHVELWASPDLKTWSKLSDFGKEYGAHGGVWECPELLEVKGENDSKWVMIVSLNPGGPNGGSATQYFTGSFDGKVFKADRPKDEIQWLDYGPDNYAGVTFSNAPDDRKIFMGWMSNWAYAQVVPTTEWRSAMTAPRDLTLRKVDNVYYVASRPSQEYLNAAATGEKIADLLVKDSLNVSAQRSVDVRHAILIGEAQAKSFALEFSNNAGQKVVVGYDAKEKTYYLDRSASGKTDFSTAFNGRNFAKRISTSGKISFTVITDVSSMEVFFDDGLSVLTAVFFPDQPLSSLTIKAPGETRLSNVEVKKMKSIW